MSDSFLNLNPNPLNYQEIWEENKCHNKIDTEDFYTKVNDIWVVVTEYSGFQKLVNDLDSRLKAIENNMGDLVTKAHIGAHMSRLQNELWNRLEFNLESISARIKQVDKAKMDKIHCLELLDRKASSESMEKFMQKIHEMRVKVEEKVMDKLNECISEVQRDMRDKINYDEVDQKLIYYTKIESTNRINDKFENFLTEYAVLKFNFDKFRESNLQNENEAESTISRINNNLHSLNQSNDIFRAKIEEVMEVASSIEENFNEIDLKLESLQEKKDHDLKRRNEVEQKVRGYEAMSKKITKDMDHFRNQNATIDHDLKVIDQTLGSVQDYLGIFEKNCSRDNDFMTKNYVATKIKLDNLNNEIELFKRTFKKKVAEVDAKLDSTKGLKNAVMKDKGVINAEIQEILRGHEEQLIILKSNQDNMKAPLNDYVDLLTNEMANMNEQYENVNKSYMELARQNRSMTSEIDYYKSSNSLYNLTSAENMNMRSLQNITSNSMNNTFASGMTGANTTGNNFISASEKVNLNASQNTFNQRLKSKDSMKVIKYKESVSLIDSKQYRKDVYEEDKPVSRSMRSNSYLMKRKKINTIKSSLKRENNGNYKPIEGDFIQEGNENYEKFKLNKFEYMYR